MDNVTFCFKRKEKDEFQFRDDKRKNGWEIIIPGASVPSGNPKFEILPILIGDEKKIDGPNMFCRALAKKVAGQALAEHFIEYQNEIPENLRGKALIFAGTLWLDDDSLYVPCLYWSGDKWYLDFYYLDNDWYSNDCFFCLCA